jgi:archaellum biogenesis ATPase FlaH
MSITLEHDKPSAALAFGNIVGIQVVPLDPVTDEPVQPVRYLEGLDAVSEHWTAFPHHSVGIVLGAPGHFCAIEVDAGSDSGYNALRKRYEELPHLGDYAPVFARRYAGEERPWEFVTENLGTGERETLSGTSPEITSLGTTMILGFDEPRLKSQDLAPGVRLRTSGILPVPVVDDVHSPELRSWLAIGTCTNALGFPQTEAFVNLEDDFVSDHLPADDGDITESLDDVKLEAVDFLWAPFVPKGKLVVIAGEPKDGKSTLAVTLCAALTAGRALPCEPADVRREPTNVVYFTAEDGIGDTILPRAMAAGANLSRFRTAGLTYVEWENKKRVDKTVTLKNTAKLRDILERHRPSLLVVDPIQAFIGADCDLHKANSVRPILAGIAELAEEFGTTILLVAHLTKNTENRGANRILGSIDFVAAARAVLMTARDPSSKDRYLCLERATYGGDDGALSYEIVSGEPIPIPGTDRSVEPAMCVFGSEIEELHRDDIIKRGGDDSSEGASPAVDRVKRFLRETLVVGQWFDAENLRKKTGASVSTWKRAKASLEDEGFVVASRAVRTTSGDRIERWEVGLEFVFGADAA